MVCDTQKENLECKKILNFSLENCQSVLKQVQAGKIRIMAALDAINWRITLIIGRHFRKIDNGCLTGRSLRSIETKAVLY